MNKLEQAARQALEALDLAKGSHGVMLMSNPPHDAWLYRGCDFKISEAIIALREALAEQAEQRSDSERMEPVAFADKYGNVVKAKDKLESTDVRSNWYDRPLYEKAAFDADLYSVAGKLALELECLLMDTKDLSVVSKWWDSAHDALEQWRSIKDAAPVRTKDLTDDELQPFLDEWWNLPCDTAHDVKKIFRAVIAAGTEDDDGAAASKVSQPKASPVDAAKAARAAKLTNASAEGMPF